MKKVRKFAKKLLSNFCGSTAVKSAVYNAETVEKKIMIERMPQYALSTSIFVAVPQPACGIQLGIRMSKSEIRIPKQERSIEKKERIVKAGYEIFCEKGYHNTNTAEIAKRAGVATGSVYSYFEDKKSIFLAMLDLYANDIAKGMFSEIEKLDPSLDMPVLINNIIQSFIKSHVISKSAHEEMVAMSHLDEDVRQYFHTFKTKIVGQLVEILAANGIQPVNAKEKIYLAYSIIEELCHEVVYHKQDSINYEVMMKETIEIIAGLLATDNVVQK